MIISRLAPTPSGFLHIGNAVNFILTWLLVRKQHGCLWLRIDDLDAPRIRGEYLEDVFRTLDWLGLEVDKGPSGPEDHLRNYSQQLRQETYHKLIGQLTENQESVFACACSRKDIRQHADDGQYPGTCRKVDIPLDQEDTALRVLTPEGTAISWEDQWLGNMEVDIFKSMRDFVIRRKDGIPAYQIASLSDDISMGVNAIVRGADLAESTAAQYFLSGLLGEISFREVDFYHHPLFMGRDGQKLSKSAGATSLKDMRESGVKPQVIFQKVAELLGEKAIITHLQQLLDIPWENRAIHPVSI